MSSPQYLPPQHPVQYPPALGDPFGSGPGSTPKPPRTAGAIGVIVAVALVVVVVAGAVAYPMVTRVSGEPTAAAPADARSAPLKVEGAPSVATGYGLRVAPPSAHNIDNRVVVTVFEDLQCPACKQFEIMFGDALTTLRANPDVIVEYRMISFLDGASTNKYSSRATNASACVAEATASGGDWSTWLRYHAMLYDQQPAEGGAGHDDTKLASLALSAGSTDVQGCITANTYADWVSAGTRDALTDVQATPTVQINGHAVDLTTPSDLLSAVEQAIR